MAIGNGRRVWATVVLTSALTWSTYESWGQVDDSTSFYVTFPKYEYKQTMGSIRELDLRNLHLKIFDERGDVELSAALANGLYDWIRRTDAEKQCGSSEWVSLVGAHYFDFRGGEPQHALGSFYWVSTGGSSTDYGIVQVYDLKSNRLEVAQQILYFAKGPGTAATFDITSGTLTIRARLYDRLDIIAFSWVDSHFTKKSLKTIPRPPPH